jgi:outer membrane protein assembly factor BamA
VSIKRLFYIASILVLMGASAGSKSRAGDVEDAPENQSERSQAKNSPSRRWNLSSASFSAADVETEWHRIAVKLEPYFGQIIDTIVVSGNDRTKRQTIVREMATKQGAALEAELVRRDASYLRGMGFFSDVDISASRAVAPGRCRIDVSIVERPGLFMKYPYPVVNYDFEDGLSYGLRWRIKNFRGRGEELKIHALKRREKEHGGSISWRVPWLMGHRLQFSSSLFTYRRLEEPESDDFIKERNGISAYFGFPLSSSLVRQLWLGTTLSIEARSSRLTGLQDGLLTSDLYRQNLLATGLELIYDSRDNRVSAWNGLYGRLRAIRFTSFHGLEQSYIFYLAASYFYIPVGSLGTLIVALEGDVREGDLPVFFEMGIGGTYDLRGFPENDLKGRAKVMGTLQLRRPVYGPRVFDIPYIGNFDLALNAVAFIDNAALMDRISDFSDSRYYTTGGIGIEVISPIQDMLRLEVAGDRDGNMAYYLSSGTRF